MNILEWGALDKAGNILNTTISATQLKKSTNWRKTEVTGIDWPGRASPHWESSYVNSGKQNKDGPAIAMMSSADAICTATGWPFLAQTYQIMKHIKTIYRVRLFPESLDWKPRGPWWLLPIKLTFGGRRQEALRFETDLYCIMRQTPKVIRKK